MTRLKSNVKPLNLILTNKERLISIAEATKLFPVVDGKTKSVISLYRYAARGIHGNVLESVIDGGRIWTSRPAVKRFLAAIASSRAGLYPPASKPKPKTRKRVSQ